MMRKKYDVFISFRGEDTRGNILSHLLDALHRKQVKPFVDDKELQRGEEISHGVIKAIEDSYVSIVIFSENYASSKWCLDEMNKIMECKKDEKLVVIPMFYKIAPSHVRKGESYKNALAKHASDPKDKDKVQKWEENLIKASEIGGWPSKVYPTEAELIKVIVNDVLEKLNDLYPPESNLIVGIAENCAQIESLLQIGTREIRMIGIRGQRGIGKTTLAIALYEKLSPQFEGHCFLENVSKLSEDYGSKFLRNKLFSDLLGENVRVDENTVESSFVKTRLRRKKVFIVLDDVTKSEQLEDTINDYYELGPGSRVIVISRDKKILNHVDDIYEAKKLSLNDCRKLFCLCAFKQRYPEKEYEELSERIIEQCKHNPFALKVAGSALRGTSAQHWEDAVQDIINDGPGSRVIERGRGVKIWIDVIRYKEKELSLNDCRELFCLCAFKQGYPEKEYEELSERIIEQCKHNPFALKVAGSALRGTSTQHWKDAVQVFN